MKMSSWHRDLERNAQRRGASRIPLAWMTSPGFRAVLLYRLARRLFLAGKLSRIIGRLVFRHAGRTTACEISPLATIGAGLHLPHPTGIVIGEGATIGRDVTLYQNVTVGRVGRKVDAYPIIEDQVTVYAGAVIVGGVSIGTAAVIAANAVVTCDVPAGAVFGGVPARDLRRAGAAAIPLVASPSAPRQGEQAPLDRA